MIYEIKEKDNKKYITFPLLTELGLNNVFTTNSMDFRMRETISIDELYKNYIILKEVINSSNKLLFSTCQVHKDSISSVKTLNDGVPYTFGQEFENTDGLITNRDDVILKTVFADCTPLLLFDPIKKFQSSLHSGWRGTTLRIGEKGVQKMVDEYDSKPTDIIAIIGPAISKEDFEVEIDVLNIFKASFPYLKDYVTKKNDSKYLIDIKGLNKQILTLAGLKDENIHICDLNTFDNPLFHSHRFQGEKAGRMIMMSSISK